MLRALLLCKFCKISALKYQVIPSTALFSHSPSFNILLTLTTPFIGSSVISFGLETYSRDSYSRMVSPLSALDRLENICANSSYPCPVLAPILPVSPRTETRRPRNSIVRICLNDSSLKCSQASHFLRCFGGASK